MSTQRFVAALLRGNETRAEQIRAARRADLMYCALRICEDNMRVLHIDHVSRPAVASFHHSSAGGRSFDVHYLRDDTRLLEFMVSEQVRPNTGIDLPSHELVERASVVLMQEAERLLRDGGR